MRFTHGSLIEAIMEGVGSLESIVRANADNLRWDERLGPRRVAAFERPGYLPARSRWADLLDGYARYYEERLVWDGRGPVSEPFGADNDGAALEVLPDEDREVVRIVKILPVLQAIGIEPGAFRSAFDLHMAAGPGDRDGTVLDARAVVQELVDAWNAYETRPPAFVGFAQDVEDELRVADVFHALRDRFGLGKLHVAPGGAPIPVMLLRYRVRDVLSKAAGLCPPEASFRVPTALDSNFYEFFLPAPTPLPYGRTVHLAGELDERVLTCELIHLPTDIDLAHIASVGAIARPIPDVALGRLRDVHLWLLRYETDRPDFGDWMCGHEPC